MRTDQQILEKKSIFEFSAFVRSFLLELFFVHFFLFIRHLYLTWECPDMTFRVVVVIFLKSYTLKLRFYNLFGLLSPYK